MYTLHNKLINATKLLGYLDLSNGMCYGFSIKWLEAILLGESNIFLSRMERFLKIEPLEKIAEDDIHLGDISAFFDNVTLYQAPNHFIQLFNVIYVQGDIERISLIAGSEQIEKQGGLKTISYIPCVFYCASDIEIYLSQLSDKIKSSNISLMTIGILCSIRASYSCGHAIGLCYRTDNDTWSMMDINDWPEKNELSIQDIASIIVQNYMKDSFHVIEISIVSTQHQAKLFSVFEKSFPKSADVENTIIVRKEAAFSIVTLLKYGYASLIQKLVHVGFDLHHVLNIHNETLAYFAASYGHASVIAELAKNGVDLNKVTSDGDTPALIAAEKGHSAVIEELAKNNIDLNQVNIIGTTPAAIAAYLGHVSVIKVLAKYGADLNKEMNNAGTPAYWAAHAGHIAVIEELAEQGVDFGKPFKMSASSLRAWLENNAQEIKERMEKFIAHCEDKTVFFIYPEHIAYIMGHKEIVQYLFGRKIIGCIGALNAIWNKAEELKKRGSENGRCTYQSYVKAAAKAYALHYEIKGALEQYFFTRNRQKLQQCIENAIGSARRSELKTHRGFTFFKSVKTDAIEKVDELERVLKRII